MERIERKVLKEKPAAGAELGFGKYFTDYLFTMRYESGRGWHSPRIEPNEPLAFDLASSVFHYGQGVFEGMKAFLQPDGSVAIFRPEENWARMERSCERLCIPPVPADLAEEGLEELIRLERDWIPRGEGTALYIRPAVVATRPALGVHASDRYLFFILLSPVGNYYARGLAPTRLVAEDTFVRCPIGGTGEAKCLGNYAVSLKAGELAEKAGYDQVLWLDAAEHRYIEEAGSMNAFFVLGGEVVTPALVGSILHGVTRKSCLTLLREKGIPVSERRISIEEVTAGAESGALTEAFGTGTAAVVSPIGDIRYRGKDYAIGGTGEIARMLYGELTGIQRGRLPDRFGWLRKI